MTSTVLLALLSFWRRNPLQLFTLLAGLALGTALWSGVQAINAEARASYDAAAENLGQGRFDRLSPRGEGGMPQATYIALRRAGWAVSPVVEGRYHGIRLVGIDPLTAPGGVGPIAPQTADLAAFVSGQGQIFARPEVLVALPDSGMQRIPAPDMAPGTAMTDIGVAQRLLKQEGRIDYLLVSPDQPLIRRPLAELAPDLVLSAAEDTTDVAQLTDSFHLNLTAFGLLSFAVGLFIVHGAIGLAFEQRRPMLRSLRALGVPLWLLMAAMAAELLLLALVAGALGVLAGYGVAAALLPDVAASLRGLYGAEVSRELSLRPAWWLAGLAMAVSGTGVAAAGAIWQLARLPLLAIAQPRAWAMGRHGKAPALRQTALALALLALAGGLAVWGNGLLSGFALLGALLLGGAVALPPLLSTLLHLAEGAARRPVAQWFWADTRQQLPGLSLALMALLLAMAANVGVSTMVSSFRLTFTGFLDQRLAAELYVQVQSPAQADALAEVAARHAEALLPILSQEQTIAGTPAEVNGARDHATYRDNWQFLRAVPQVWDRLAAGDGVLVNEQLYRRAGLDLGALVTLTPDLRLPVIGIYGDYGNPIGQAIVTESLFRKAYPGIEATRFGLRAAPDQVAPLRDALRRDAGLPPEAITDQAAIKALSLSIFERTFTVTTALNILTLAVAGFAMLMSLLTLAAMRLPQLAPVWALGLTRHHLAGLDLIRALVLAGLSALVALPLGLALAWALLAVVNVEAFGWRLPMYLFPADYLRLGGLALLAAILAALWPAWRLSRLAPTQLLGVFRHER